MGVVAQAILVIAVVFIGAGIIIAYIQDEDFRTWVRKYNFFLKKKKLDVEIVKIEKTEYKDQINSIFLLDRFHKNYERNKNIKAAIVHFKSVDGTEIQLLLSAREMSKGIELNSKGVLKYYKSYYVSFKK